MSNHANFRVDVNNETGMIADIAFEEQFEVGIMSMGVSSFFLGQWFEFNEAQICSFSVVIILDILNLWERYCLLFSFLHRP